MQKGANHDMITNDHTGETVEIEETVKTNNDSDHDVITSDHNGDTSKNKEIKMSPLYDLLCTETVHRFQVGDKLEVIGSGETYYYTVQDKTDHGMHVITP